MTHPNLFPNIPSIGDCLPSVQISQETLAFLAQRRSTPIKLMGGPGPDESQLENILKIASRVPDHRKLEPWRFIIIKGEGAHKLGETLYKIRKDTHPDLIEADYEEDKNRFLRAPVCVAIISSPDPAHKTPVWEQELSAGALCMNLLLAARASGWAASWLTEWFAFSQSFSQHLGLSNNERIAGFIYIGTANQMIPERPRPDLKDKIQYWQE